MTAESVSVPLTPPEIAALTKLVSEALRDHTISKAKARALRAILNKLDHTK